MGNKCYESVKGGIRRKLTALQNFLQGYDRNSDWSNNVHVMRGVFKAAKADFDGCYLFNVQTTISGEII